MGLNLKVVLTWEMGAERGTGSGGGDGDLGDGDRDLDDGVGDLGSEDGDLGGGDGDLGGGEGDLGGWVSLPILPSKESSGR